MASFLQFTHSPCTFLERTHSSSDQSSTHLFIEYWCAFLGSPFPCMPRECDEGWNALHFSTNNPQWTVRTCPWSFSRCGHRQATICVSHSFPSSSRCKAATLLLSWNYPPPASFLLSNWSSYTNPLTPPSSFQSCRSSLPPAAWAHTSSGTASHASPYSPILSCRSRSCRPIGFHWWLWLLCWIRKGLLHVGI